LPTQSPKWPADKVERRPIAQLIPAARNARTHSDEQVVQILIGFSDDVAATARTRRWLPRR